MPSRDRYDPGWGYGGPRYPGAFLLALQEALATLNWQARRWLPSAVDCIDAQGREQLLGLDNLFRRVRPLERIGWSGVLAEFLGKLPTDPVELLTADLHAVAGRILVRLAPPLARRREDTDLWTHELVPRHLAAALVIDAPDSMVYVTEAMVEASGKSGAHWLEHALNNLRALAPASRLTVAHAESGLLHCEAGDAYDASRALLLDDLLPGHEAHGFFVAVPGRDHLLVLPVTYPAVGFLPWLRTITDKTHRTLPYPISAEVFWVRQGQWHHVGIELEDERVTVTPPPALVDILETLAPPKNDTAPRTDDPAHEE